MTATVGVSYYHESNGIVTKSTMSRVIMIT